MKQLQASKYHAQITTNSTIVIEITRETVDLICTVHLKYDLKKRNVIRAIEKKFPRT